MATTVKARNHLTLPKQVLDRNPHNKAHVTAAYQIVQELSGINILASTVMELALIGAVLKEPLLPKRFRIRKRIRKGNWTIGAMFTLEAGLLFPDNVIRRCHNCPNALQFRPNLGHSAGTPLCVFCAADRLLKDHWANTV